MRITPLLVVAALTAPAPAEWPSTEVALGGPPQRVGLATLDGDDTLDALVVTGPRSLLSPNEIVVLGNAGNGRLAPTWSVGVITDFGDNGVPFAIGDLDLDGDQDLVTANNSNWGGMVVRLGDGSGTFPDASIGPHFGGYVDDLALVLHDDDEYLDVVEANRDFSWYVDRFNGLGDGTFASSLPFTSYSGQGPFEIAAGFATSSSTPVEVVSGISGLDLIGVGVGGPLYEEPTREVVLVDLDDDGLDDVAAAAPLQRAVVTLRSLDGGAFDAPTLVSTSGRRPTGLCAADLDLDGDVDLVVTHAGSRSIGLLSNDGKGHLTVTATLPVGSGPVAVAAGDLDGDGDPDLVVANEGDESLTVLRNPAR